MFATFARHAPQANSGSSPFAWGTEARLEELFGAYGSVNASNKHVVLRARTPMDWVDKLRAGYAPVLKVFSSLDSSQQKSLRGDLLELPFMLISVVWGMLIAPLLRFVVLLPVSFVRGRRSRAVRIEAVSGFPQREVYLWTTTDDGVERVLDEIVGGLAVGKFVQPEGAVYSGRE